MTGTTRRPLVAGNWKLHNTITDSLALVRAIQGGPGSAPSCEVAVAPVFTALRSVADALEGSPIRLGAQDVHWDDQGAFTGEVSAPLLRDAGCSMCIVGHSERRHVFGETDDAVRKKIGALLEHDLTPIACVGETLQEREASRTFEVVGGQLDAALEGLSQDQAGRLVIAYEPVWAIGTGRTASPADAQEVHELIRRRLAEAGGDGLAAGIRVLYGGSVKPDNATALMDQPDIDGALVGGASLKPEAFTAIVEAASASL